VSALPCGRQDSNGNRNIGRDCIEPVQTRSKSNTNYGGINMTHNLEEKRQQIREDLVTMWRVAEYNHDVTGKACDELDRLTEVAQHGQGYDGEGHYGTYGNNCMNTGQFDAGECWLCYAKRKKTREAQQDAVITSKEIQIDDLVARAKILQEDSKKYKKARYDTLEQHEKLSAEWKASREVLIRERNEMQLVAGRYQFQFEHAMKALNSIDDVFEYAYEKMTPDQLRVIVRTALAKFTDAVNKVNKKGG